MIGPWGVLLLVGAVCAGLWLAWLGLDKFERIQFLRDLERRRKERNDGGN